MKLLYKLPLREASQTDESDTLGSQLAEASVLEGSGVVEQLSSEVPDLQLEGQFQGIPQWQAQLHAEELEELADSSLESLPLFRRNGRYAESAYYEIESATIEPAQGNSRGVYVWSLGLKKKGTRHDFFRALKPSYPPLDLEHEFGNEYGQALMGIPGSARKTQWFDIETGDRDSAEPVETVESEFGEIALFDLEEGADAVDGEDPVLLYDVDYADDAGPYDCKVYDTLGVADKYLENEEGRVRVWESVFATGHDPEGEIVLDNGLIRLRLDEDDGTLEAERWDPDAAAPQPGSGLWGDGLWGDELWGGTQGAWTDVSLSQPGDVDLYDVDVTRIGMVRDEVQLTFDVDGDLFALNAILAAGHDEILFDLPDGQQGPIPEDLEEWLEPIASESVVDAGARKTLVSRNDVQR
ncbi:hypothetical protein [Natrarchaeobius oligotrophus]|uniref:Uncharacterized protein n=1 Tax=Natrarchaeobius chitinivorans TaxID=1679083 RepID=A0A3N6PB75_NATCH|nr:hypothetical protein [Natrarchaeobius chitinivorans]RQG93765.1 hypothetical protein EA472_22585 [Natrarchaeobius chitinivorans]